MEKLNKTQINNGLFYGLLFFWILFLGSRPLNSFIHPELWVPIGICELFSLKFQSSTIESFRIIAIVLGCLLFFLRRWYLLVLFLGLSLIWSSSLMSWGTKTHAMTPLLIGLFLTSPPLLAKNKLKMKECRLLLIMLIGVLYISAALTKLISAQFIQPEEFSKNLNYMFIREVTWNNDIMILFPYIDFIIGNVWFLSIVPWLIIFFECFMGLVLLFKPHRWEPLALLFCFHFLTLLVFGLDFFGLLILLPLLLIFSGEFNGSKKKLRELISPMKRPLVGAAIFLLLNLGQLFYELPPLSIPFFGFLALWPLYIVLFGLGLLIVFTDR